MKDSMVNDFNTKLESEINGLTHKQITFFLWLFSIRTLPFLGENNTFSFWNKADMMKNIYAIFIALDTIAETMQIQGIFPKFIKNDEPTSFLTKNFNGTPLYKIPLYGEVHENITIAAETAKDTFSHIPTAAVNSAYIVSVLLADAKLAFLTTISLFNAFDIKTLKTENVKFSDIVLEDLKFIKSNNLKKLNNDISIYGGKWNNLKCALEKYGCKYWGDFLTNVFMSGFRINMQALEQRLSVPKEIKDLGAKAVAEHLTAAEKQGSVRFKDEPKLFMLDLGKTPDEAEYFFYKRCSKCDKISDAKYEVCPFCSGIFKEGCGIGLIPKTELDKKFLKSLESLKDGYNLTCGKCGNIFYSINTNEICPRCGDTNPKNYMPRLLNGVKLTQEIKIVKRDAKNNKKILEMQFRDEKPQVDGTTAMFRRIIDKEKDDYQELVVVNQTGEIKHICHEPLSEHQGHGSAKNKP